MTSKKKKNEALCAGFQEPDVPVKAGRLRKARKAIIALLNETQKTGTLTELSDFLERSACLTHAETAAALRDMYFDGTLVQAEKDSCSKKSLWRLSAQSLWFEGVVQGRRSGEYVVEDPQSGEMLKVRGEDAIPVLPGDRIFVSRATNSHERTAPAVAWIEKFIERKTKQLVCRAVSQCPVKIRSEVFFWAKPADPFSPTDILVHGNPSNYCGKAFVVELEKEARHLDKGLYVISGSVKDVLGESEDPSVELAVAVQRFGLPHVFSQDALEQAKALPDAVDPSDIKGRIDLRDIRFVTIDGEDAKDFDDAVWAMPLKNGWRLLVAIADVSRYVTCGSALDRDAQERATSVYFPRCVIPMLPEKLSNGLCSLNPGVDRLSVVCDMVISKEGTVKAYQFYRAVICSHARLTYASAYAAMCEDARDAVERGGNSEDIACLKSLFEAFRRARSKRGAIDFETAETQIVCSEDGRIEQVKKRDHTDAHRMIEECMLAANTCAADFMLRKKLTCLFRVHDSPAADRLNALRAELSAFGLTLAGGLKPAAGDFEQVLSAVSDDVRREVVQLAMLRTMQQAVYSPANIGHYGLNYPAYTHFTSPIRRYPDLLVHRTICASLDKKEYVPELFVSTDWLKSSHAAQSAEKTIKAVRVKSQASENGSKALWDKIGLLCSASERRADEASRDVTAWLKCVYANSLPRKPFRALVTGVNRAGLYVTLCDSFIEGFVHISKVGDDYFYFNEQTQTFEGSACAVSYGLGDAVFVEIDSVDTEARTIDFRMVRQNKIKGKSGRPRSGGKKTKRFFN